MISERLTRLTYYFPWSLVVALLLALIFAVIGIMIFRSAIKKGEEDGSSPEKTSPLLDKLQIFAARFGYFGTTPLSQSFNYALKLMYNFIGGTQFRYKLPWIVMLGTSNSGKSAALEALNLDRPIGRPHFDTEGLLKPLCDWWFYDHGTVLDLDGKIVLSPTRASSDEDNWKLFLNLLVHHRSKRPLDGIVLTIPATELIGDGMLSHDDLMVRAEYLYGKLWQVQYLTGIRVPIYVVVTKCDTIPGFHSLCNSLPNHSRHDIFGWSNDRAVDSSYTSEWIDEAFASINASLYRIQEEIYADGKTIDGRDGVFLFPVMFNQIKGGLKTYANHLFKASGYHEAFFLRGLYFVGDSHVEKPGRVRQVASDLSLSYMHDDASRTRNIYFIDNLFENKIFREVGLARPVSRVLLGNTTAMRFAKIGVAIAAIVGTLSLLRANEVLQSAKMNLVPALTQIEVTLEKIHGQNEETEIGRVFFEDQAQALLNMMTQISVNTLSSVFIPPSWFDNLDAKIKFVMGIAYERVVIRSLASQLTYKAIQLFSLDTVIPVTEATSNGIDPLETAQFYRFRNYVLAVRALELAANKYNDLGMTSSLKDVSEIIKYLFNYDLPADFYEHTNFYVDALKETNTKLFDFDGFRDDASIKLRKLFDEFQLASFDPNQMIPGLGRLMTSLYEFSGARNYTAYDADLLREIYVSLGETIGSIKNPGLEWLDADHFNPGPQYEYVVGLIVGSAFFTSTTASDLISELDQNFTAFRRRLAGYTSPLINGGNLFNVENDLAIAAPSEGALALEQNLSVFFAEPFMAATESRNIITAIPIGSVLLWDTLRLQQAVQLISSYNNFMNSHLLNMPKVLQPMLQKVGRDNLTLNLVRFIVDAEVFSSETLIGVSTSPEDALLSQVQNYRAAAPYLEQILFALKANNANSAFSTLKDLLTGQTYNPLAKLDEILTDESPYAIKMNSFDWWKGDSLAALEAFGVSTLTELKGYLELQRDRINYLAREFADPLVSFLEQVNKEGMPGNFPLATKWSGITSALNGYSRKEPGNALLELENYIMNPLNEVTLATCLKYASTVNPLSANQDFFVNILINLQEKLHDRCVDLSGYVSADNYSDLAQFFNANLAGKFPFSDAQNISAPDANPEDIRTLFDMIDTQSNNIKATLKQATNLGPAGKSALTFITQLEKVRSFFGDYLAPNSTLPSPAFTFDVTFRVNQSREVRANEILDWELTTQNTTLNMRSTSPLGYWREGDPIKMTFRWALNSPLQPQMINDMSNFDVQGENASFAYEGTWALLRLLRQHQAKPSDFDSLNDETPITLRFDIPLTNVVSNSQVSSQDEEKNAIVFVRLKVSPLQMASPKQTTSAAPKGEISPKQAIRMGTPVSLPYFPYSAPRLNNPGN
ncbi:MAG: hypothetical protein JSR85_05015 [Proteobacteria bacterium]|nr:hypothetical protein [Pseudomonadota bacterium]